MDPRFALGMLIDFGKSAKEAALEDVLGCLDGLAFGVDFVENNMRQTECCVNGSIIDACIALFAQPYEKVVVALPTWTYPHWTAEGYHPSLSGLGDALLKDGSRDFSAILWPFHMHPDDSPNHDHYFLCVIEPNFLATIYDSRGKGALYTGVVKDALATTPWSKWRVVVGAATKHENEFDTGLYCIANAAYTIAECRRPSKINAKFWRIACWSAIGLQDNNTYLANTLQIFAHLHGRPEAEVRSAVQRIKDEDGLRVLKKLVVGPPFKWWIYWEDKMRTLTRAFKDLKQAHDNLGTAPLLYEEVRVDKMDEDFMKMFRDAEDYEHSSERTRREIVLQIAARERMESVVSRMETLDDLIPAIMNRV